MPEFVMEGRDHAALLEGDFVLGFIEAAFFCETSQFDSSDWNEPETQEAIEEGAGDGNIPSDAGYLDIDAESFAKIHRFCANFQAAFDDLLSRAYATGYDETQAGRDLYFTYAQHGVGFWSRDELEADNIGRDLSDVAGRGEIILSAEVSETGKITVRFDIY